jgi:hypothetical protein
MADPIVEEALKAVQSLTGGQMPVRTERNAAPRSQGGRTVNSGELVVSTKGAGYMGVDDEPAGSALNPIAQLGLFAKIRKEASWLRYTTFAPVTENSGYLDLWDDRNFKMHPTPSEGPRRNIPLHKPDVDQKSYSTSTMSGAFGLRLKSIRSAARAGQNVNSLVQSGIAAGIANVLADLGINGNTDLPDDTDLNKQRSTVNGWFQKLRLNSPNYQGRADGFSYHNGIWAGMLQQIDKAYRTDKGLAWGMSDTLSTRWLTELSATGSSPSNAHPSIVNDLGSALLNAMGAQANPLGKPGVVIPQIEDDRFGSDEGYEGIAPTSITNNGDGTLTINVNTLAGSGTDRSSTGADGQRYVTIGNASTGVSETIAIDYSAPNNTVTTASLLGQTVVSTTASDYFVRWADNQSLFLGLWRFLVLVVQNGMRIYTVFYPHDETIEVIVHMDIDYMVADYEATSLVDDLITPRFDIFG